MGKKLSILSLIFLIIKLSRHKEYLLKTSEFMICFSEDVWIHKYFQRVKLKMYTQILSS